MEPIRQGDVILTPVLSPTDFQYATLFLHLNLAESEATGHKHRITSGYAELLALFGNLYLRVLSEIATLTHEEHKPIQIPQGTWMVLLQQQYEPAGWNHVQD